MWAGSGQANRNNRVRVRCRPKECLLWVRRVILTVRRSIPVYPDKRTIQEPVGTSHLCHKRTFPADINGGLGARKMDKSWLREVSQPLIAALSL
jgi:hypothetical protein